MLFEISFFQRIVVLVTHEFAAGIASMWVWPKSQPVEWHVTIDDGLRLSLSPTSFA